MRRIGSGRRVSGALVAASVVCACARDTTQPPPVTPVSRVLVSPNTGSVLVSEMVALAATPLDAAGNPLVGRSVSWVSRQPTIAHVDPTGVVTGVQTGAATITAMSEGKADSATLTVQALPTDSACGATGAGVCYYVNATAGNDTNPGTSARPFATLQAAANRVNPGDGVLVRDGVYTGGEPIVLLARSGTPANLIVVRAEHRGGAIIDGRTDSSTTGIELTASYVRVEGFEVRGTARYGIDAESGTAIQIAKNHVHDIGRRCTDSPEGIVGINAYASNLVIEQNLVHDVGRYGPGENGCTPTTNNWQNHDHAVYMGVGDNVIIRDNVCYNLTHGWAVHRYDAGGTVVHQLAIVNNTFVGANPNRPGQILIATPTAGLLIANNIFYKPATAGVDIETGGLSGVSINNNVTTGGTALTGSSSGVTLGANLDNTDPLFLNASTFDFHVQTTSPAIGAGLVLLSVLTDFDGLIRSASANTIGAYQN